MKKYQQGDVLIIEKENDDEWKKASESQYRKTHIKRNGDDGNVVLAFGEVTGHSHQFKPEEMLNDGSDKLLSYHDINSKYSEGGSSDVIEDEAKAIQVLADEGMTLYHEEHAPITVPPGRYRVKIVQQFDHMTQTVSRVWD